MKFVNAQAKPVELLPDWLKCCPQAIEALAKHAGTRLTLVADSGHTSNDRFCSFCGKPDPPELALSGPDGGFIYACEVDLDEGEYHP